RNIEINEGNIHFSSNHTQPETTTITGISSIYEEKFHKKTTKRVARIMIIAIITTIMILLSAYFLINIYPSLENQDCNMYQGNSRNMNCAFQAPNGENIGLSYGGFAFDTRQEDGDLKRQAANQYSIGDITGAISLWQKAIKHNSNDGEALIYLE